MPARGHYEQIGLEPGFVAVVYPAPLREVLERILRRAPPRRFLQPDRRDVGSLRAGTSRTAGQAAERVSAVPAGGVTLRLDALPRVR